MRSAAYASAARTSGARARSAASKSAAVSASSSAAAGLQPSRRAGYSPSAASPPARTAASISSTVRGVSGAPASGGRPTGPPTASRPGRRPRAPSLRAGPAAPAGPPRGIVALPELARHGDDEPAESEPEIQRLVHVRPLLEQNILADDPQVGRAVQDVRRDVDRFEEQQA